MFLYFPINKNNDLILIRRYRTNEQIKKILYDVLKLGKYGAYGVKKVLDERIIHTDSNFAMSDCLNRVMKDST